MLRDGARPISAWVGLPSATTLYQSAAKIHGLVSELEGCRRAVRVSRQADSCGRHMENQIEEFLLAHLSAYLHEPKEGNKYAKHHDCAHGLD